MQIGALKKAFPIFDKQNWSKVQNNPEKEANNLPQIKLLRALKKENLTRSKKHRAKREINLDIILGLYQIPNHQGQQDLFSQ